MKLAVSDQVIVPVKFSLKDGLGLKSFSFNLICNRLTAEEWEESVTDPQTELRTNKRIRQTMADVTTGWEGQKFVLDDHGQPAEFCAEARDIMFAASGVLDVIVMSYMKESGARAKN